MPTRIDWADETVNPLGHWCFGPGGTKENPKPCEYCYARRLAMRGMTHCEKCRSFDTPHTHFEQLEKLKKWKKQRTVFVQSMGDLFHDEVPDEWIKAVFDACAAAPWHRYLFLTKNPKRYLELMRVELLPQRKNMWYGSTMTTRSDTYFHDKMSAIMGKTERNTFLSMEPILSPFDFGGQVLTDWAIIGAETGNRKGKVIPKREWIENIVTQCREDNIPVFMKESLRDLMGSDFVQEFGW